MLSKFVLVIAAIIFLILSSFYFIYDSSYQNSFEARFYYFIGNYSKAREFAKIAYDKDQYNKMAFTVLTQSEIAMKYVNYIESGNKYFEQINAISSKKEYKNADKIKIKMMCEIMMGEYKNLPSSKLINKELEKNAKEMDMKFKQLHKELF